MQQTSTMQYFGQRHDAERQFAGPIRNSLFFLPGLSCVFLFMLAGMWPQPAHAQAKNQQKFLKRVEGENFTHIPITRENNKTVATDPATGNTLRSDTDPRDVIGWALNMADAVVIRNGRHALSQTLEIPRSNVTLVIGKNAELASASDANLIKISEGHGGYEPLIRIKNRNHVRIINFGTITSYDIGVIFDGRNGGGIGINGGGIFSTGTLKCREGFWIVDSKNVSVPVVWGGPTLDNAPLVMEGSEDCQLGFIAGLMGKENNENETLDLNSYNRRIKMDTILGWVPGGTKDEILDINNSPKTMVDRVLGFGSAKGTKLANVHPYGMGGRRLTQKKHIDNNSKGTRVNTEKVISKPIKKWSTSVKTPEFPDRLPNLTINARLTAVFEDGTKRQVFQNRFQFDLATSSDE